MQEHKISKEDGTDINWTITRNNNNYFCLLYNDNKQKFKFIPNENLNCELFMIGGGGAGGYFFGGGGGAGSSYINNNYTFKKNKTYTFEIGTGGMCDIADINKLFKSGLILNIYNNTNVNLLNINFKHDDYSSLGIQSSGLIQSFNVNNITIPSSIFHNNTTYIWDGYIKTNSAGYFNVNINSKIKTIIWVDEFVYNNSNALIEGNNITDVKIIQLEANRFYNIKIIAYNDTNNSNNFNISFEGCELFNLDKNEEKYVYIPASDTILTYRNDDNTFETIRCKGGGNGGCGFFNKNTNLDGGCGGGSGINKIKGSSIIGASYNGYDGAIGDYCGGGGGIMSVGKNNIGGDGKIIDWFNETLIFGAGGNAANLSETRNLGYGCGGNGGECCYYSKLLINNNGNNGCILIYVKSSETLTAPSRPRITEGFTVTEKDKNMLPDDSISKKLIENSFKISKYIGTSIIDTTNRASFFGQNKDDMAYIGLIKDFPSSGKIITGGTNYKKYDDCINQTFIYDMLVISKLYAIVYRLYLHKHNTLANNKDSWKTFCETAKLNIFNSTSGASKTNITDLSGEFAVNIANLFNITNLNLNGPKVINSYDTIYTTEATVNNGSPAINTEIITKYNETEKQYLPLYHQYGTGAELKHLKLFMVDEINKNAYYAIVLDTITAGDTLSNTATKLAPANFDHGSTSWQTPGNTTIKIKHSTGGYITKDNLDAYYNFFNTRIKITTADYENYLYNRILIYLEAFNTILKTDSTIMLTTLKYYMHYYNLVVYNVSIQYGLTNMHNNRIILTTAAALPGCYIPDASTNLDTHVTNVGTCDFKFTGATTNGVSPQDIYTATTNESGAIQSIALRTGGGTVFDTYVDNAKPVGITPLVAHTPTTAAVFNVGTLVASKIVASDVTIPTPGAGYKGCTAATFDPIRNTYSLGSTLSPANEIDTDLGLLTTNLNHITEYLTKISDNASEITDRILEVSTNNTNTSDNFYEKQLDLNKTINEYNGELENFNNISFYYKLVIAFAILLIIIILVIFGTKSIDNNSKISVYVIIVVMIIIAFIIYKQYSGVKEGFTIILHKAASTYGTIATAVSESAANTYKLAVDKYITKLILTLATSNIDNNLQSSLTYIKKLSVVKNEKAEIYKIKNINLMNSIEILKKNANFYYYMIIAISFSIIILNIGLILYLLNSAMIMQIIILCAVLFIILTYYISYYIHKSTRLAENKNYWSNYNPSSSTFNNL